MDTPLFFVSRTLQSSNFEIQTRVTFLYTNPLKIPYFFKKSFRNLVSTDGRSRVWTVPLRTRSQGRYEGNNRSSSFHTNVRLRRHLRFRVVVSGSNKERSMNLKKVPQWHWWDTLYLPFPSVMSYTTISSLVTPGTLQSFCPTLYTEFQQDRIPTPDPINRRFRVTTQEIPTPTPVFKVLWGSDGMWVCPTSFSGVRRLHPRTLTFSPTTRVYVGHGSPIPVPGLSQTTLRTLSATVTVTSRYTRERRQEGGRSYGKPYQKVSVSCQS